MTAFAGLGGPCCPMLGSMLRVLAKAAVGLVLSGALLLLGASAWVQLRYREKIHSLEQAPQAPVALVFGAGLSGKEPSPVLAERLDGALALYRSGKVKKLLVSGDSSDRWHDETSAMRRYLEAKGVPSLAVVSDGAGYSTYDSCFRAQEIYAVRKAVLVTQAFHLPRALFIANSLGMDAHGVATGAGGFFQLEPREILSRALAVAMVAFRPLPQQLGTPQPIE